MSNSGREPNWRTPKGVSKGNFDYVRASHIADEYDEFLNDDPLTSVDWQIIDRYFPAFTSSESKKVPIVGDFGCGTGRALLPLVQRGYRGIGFDLSIPMLEKLHQKMDLETAKSETESSRLLRLLANLTELDGIQDNSIDHGICLFSTLGMLKGAANRLEFLQHANRIIKPKGLFIVHAHNVLFQTRHKGGLTWLASNFMASLLGRAEFGDRTATYRGINQMFIHSFRRSELNGALRQVGFQPLTWFGIKPQSREPVDNPSRLASLGHVGWIVVCSA